MAGCRNKSRVGIIVELKRGSNGWEGETWKATVLWIEQLTLSTGFTMKSTVLVRNLFVLDDDSIDPLLINVLADAYADYMFEREPSVFVAPVA